MPFSPYRMPFFLMLFMHLHEVRRPRQFQFAQDWNDSHLSFWPDSWAPPRSLPELSTAAGPLLLLLSHFCQILCCCSHLRWMTLFAKHCMWVIPVNLPHNPQPVLYDLVHRLFLKLCLHIWHILNHCRLCMQLFGCTCTCIFEYSVYLSVIYKAVAWPGLFSVLSPLCSFLSICLSLWLFLSFSLSLHLSHSPSRSVSLSLSFCPWGCFQAFTAWL